MGNTIFHTNPPTYISFKCGEVNSTNITSLPSFSTYEEIEGITKEDFLLNVNKFRAPDRIIEDIFRIDVITKITNEIDVMENYEYYILLLKKQ